MSDSYILKLQPTKILKVWIIFLKLKVTHIYHLDKHRRLFRENDKKCSQHSLNDSFWPLIKTKLMHKKIKTSTLATNKLMQFCYCFHLFFFFSFFVFAFHQELFLPLSVSVHLSYWKVWINKHGLKSIHQYSPPLFFDD